MRAAIWRLLSFLRRLLIHCEAARLNLRLDIYMATVGVAVNFTIAPTNAAGQPAQVTSIAWTTSVGIIAPTSTGMGAAFTPAAPGPVTVTVTALTQGGKTLADSKTFTVDGVAVDGEAVALNLSILPV